MPYGTRIAKWFLQLNMTWAARLAQSDHQFGGM